MQKSLRILIFFFAIFIFGNVYGQDDEMFLAAPAPGNTVILNDIINGDTTSTGDRASLNRVYVLERGGVWFFNGTVSNNGWKLKIKASDSDAAKPIIYCILNPTSTSPISDAVEMLDDVRMDNIVFHGYFDLDPEAYNGGSITGTLIHNKAPGAALELYGCVIGSARSIVLRSSAAIRLMKLVDCVFANGTAFPSASIWQPRAFDNRDAGADSIIWVNNTFINQHDKILRRRSSTAPLNYLRFEHNTAINVIGMGGTLGLGMIDGDIYIKNNLFLDAFIMGADTASHRQNDFLENGEIYGDESAWPGKARHAAIYHTLNDSLRADYTVENNLWLTSPELQAAYDNIATNGWNPGQLGSNSPIMSLYIEENNKAADPSKAFMTEDITLANVTAPWSDIAEFFNKPQAIDGGYGNSRGGDNQDLYPGYDKRLITYYRDELDVSYSTSAAAYTGGTDGFPIGNLNAFPDKKAAWEAAGGLTDIETLSEAIPADYTLEQNYPNPFNPTTTIRFSLPEAGNVSLSIYNVLGQEVARVVDQELKAGSYNYNFDASSLASGIYVYQLSTQNFVTSKKMLLLK